MMLRHVQRVENWVSLRHAGRNAPMLAMLVFLLICGNGIGCKQLVLSSGGSASRGQMSPEEVRADLERALDQIKQASKESEKIRTTLFNDSLEQARSIYCSTVKIAQLNNQIDAVPSLRKMFARQRFATLQGDYTVSIPAAKAYGIVQTHGEMNDYDYRCDESYSKPVPVSPEARRIEARAFAEEIAISVRRLNFYAEKLPQIEINASTVTALGVKLRKLSEEVRSIPTSPSWR
ncbi:MAG TPA: hypothetical protein VFE33_07525 [Thermoanaerobaculia bacterium]|nr:hypothetical protein [Thermoanaerobaculia bacterium]